MPLKQRDSRSVSPPATGVALLAGGRGLWQQAVGRHVGVMCRPSRLVVLTYARVGESIVVQLERLEVLKCAMGHDGVAEGLYAAIGPDGAVGQLREVRRGPWYEVMVVLRHRIENSLLFSPGRVGNERLADVVGAEIEPLEPRHCAPRES